MTVGGGKELPYVGKGTVLLHCVLPNGRIRPVRISNVLYVPSLSFSLFLWNCVRSHFRLVSMDNGFQVKEKNSDSVVFVMEFIGNLPFIVETKESAHISVSNMLYTF